MSEYPEATKTQIGLFVAVRIVLNASYRMVYPFLNVFASGLGVTLQTISLPLTGRSLVGALGPLLAPIADRYGRKAGMLFGLATFSLGVGLVAVWPSFTTFFLALVLAYLGNMVFLPAMQAYLGDRVPYGKRGSVLAVTEMSWSLSFIVLVPLLGLLMGRFGWSAPFFILAGFGWLSFLVIAWHIPRDLPHPQARERALWHGLGQVLGNPNARLAISFSLLLTLGNEVVNLVFGAWMKDSFHLELAALGLASTIIGVAELVGEGATALLVDRVEKKRSVTIGIIFTSLASLALPLLGRSLAGALVGLFLFYLGFEFTLVSYIPLMTEVMPQTRATLMAVNLASSSLGRAVGALAGSWLYTFGFGANAIAAVVLNGLAILVLSQVHVDE